MVIILIVISVLATLPGVGIARSSQEPAKARHT